MGLDALYVNYPDYCAEDNHIVPTKTGDWIRKHPNSTKKIKCSRCDMILRIKMIKIMDVKEVKRR